MNILAIVGGGRKGKSTDSLIERAIEGATEGYSDSKTKKLYLTDYDIKFCRNCMVCRDRDTTEPLSPCVIRDGMDAISEELQASDALIIGTPVHSGYAPGIMATFLERIAWTFSKPEGKILTIKGCPVPRSEKQRKAIIIVTSGVVPPLFRKFCDAATHHIKEVIKCSLNARTVGDMYAGALENRGVEYYLPAAKRLGKKLIKS